MCTLEDNICHKWQIRKINIELLFTMMKSVNSKLKLEQNRLGHLGCLNSFFIKSQCSAKSLNHSPSLFVFQETHKMCVDVRGLQYILISELNLLH